MIQAPLDVFACQVSANFKIYFDYECASLIYILIYFLTAKKNFIDINKQQLHYTFKNSIKSDRNTVHTLIYRQFYAPRQEINI